MTKLPLASFLAVLACLTPGCHAAAAPDPLAPTGRWSANTRGQAATPPMGWNSWNAFGAAVDETKLMASARLLVDSGLAAKGYRYVDIDDGWWLKRRMPDGRMLVRTANFPSATTADGGTSLRPLTDRLHAMGLKAGIYSDIGRNTCSQVFGGADAPNLPEGTQAERETGLYGHVEQDIALYFREWNFDLIKVDGCGIRGLGPDNPRVKAGLYRPLGPVIDFDDLPRTDIAEVRRLYGAVAQALARTRPAGDYVLSLCLWGSADVRSWGKDIGNMSRTSEDISPTWARMLHNLDTTARRALYAHPGSWNDPDMLFIGKGEFDAAHMVEARSHLALWAMLNAPLLIGMDLRQATPDQIALLGWAQAIALNQDRAGNQAVLAYDSAEVQIYVKTLADGSKAVALLNRSDAPTHATLTAEHAKLTGTIATTDLWTGKTGSFTGEITVPLGPHETVLLKLVGRHRLANGLYLSEMPGSVNPAIDGVVQPQPDPLVHRGLLPWNDTRGVGEHPRYGGWGGAAVDTGPYGQQLQAGHEKLDTGIGILAGSRMEVRNAGHARFTARVGVDDAAWGNSGAVTFLVYGDGRLLAQSAPMRAGSALVPLVANVRGVKLIELVARPAKASVAPDPVVWGEAALLN
ncbi:MULTISPECIES: NPCBM/NEW2 domain-containing protein [unclassified Novosphingobium]|uniref:NPCBM/NEW2 domain-containing protein n=1 Tax=unclassified Novosphingobium TaxID=2644732 RepID=UPI0014945DBB|nr:MULTISPECIES: NPCBM/NEW2 domain-containing protein [unclassified Novosphingobium]MBB3357919.1 hypothetical protein [Novosphingobium sp. BK256]MBB3374280.1 hypothetical protein [Novosphingobium sp. BK280]MBB3378692.1 hypothetical protein [Novosphingobium sp. BK258]MBB3420386.1 hypothetical protein [Novosphingobium sp. BK267]MBB3448492.1 hypothetical protein [Novosphingobium sp. BK352]